MILKKKSPKLNILFKFFFKKVLLITFFLLLILISLNINYFKINLLKKNIIFDKTEHFYAEPIIVNLISPIASAEIFYSLDGSDPNHNSIKFDPNNPIYLDETTVVKAVLYKKGKSLAPIISHDYFIDFFSNLPIISLSTNPQNLWDSKIGIYVDGDNKNYFQQGKEWERPAKLSFYLNNKNEFSREVEIRINGGGSVEFPQKSLRVDIKNNGKNDTLNYNLFPNSDTKYFNTFVLHNSGNDWYSTMIRDCLMHNLLENSTKLDLKACLPAVTFINGEYWGIYNIRERYNEDYFINKYNKSKIDSKKIILSKTTNKFNEQGFPIIQIGTEKDAQKYIDLIKYVQHQNMAEHMYFQNVQKEIDIENFIDYNIAEMFYANHDWPHANIAFWRYKNDLHDEIDLAPLDGKWRWLLYDTDYGFGLKYGGEDKMEEESVTINMLKKIEKEEFVFSNLFKNKDFRNQFINRYCDLLNSTFLPNNLISKINGLSGSISREIPRHIERWKNFDTNFLQSYSQWEEEIENLRQFARQRPNIVKQHLKEYFSLSNTFPIIININDLEAGIIQINSINIDKETFPWQGEYFSDIKINLKAIPNKNYHFVNWEGEISYFNDKSRRLNPEISIYLYEPTSLKAVFAKN